MSKQVLQWLSAFLFLQGGDLNLSREADGRPLQPMTHGDITVDGGGPSAINYQH